MFKNQSSFSDQTNNPLQPQNPVEAVVNTMAKDLQDPTGSLSRLRALKEDAPAAPGRSTTGEQQNSPFLKTMGAQNFSQKQGPVNTQPAILASGEPPKNSNLYIIAAILIIIIVLAGGGTYYFMLTREASNDATSLPEELPITEETIAENEPQAQPNQNDYSYFQTGSPNYLVMEEGSISPATFKQFLNDTISRISASETTGLIEFIPVNAQNDPLSFSDFSSLSGISLSATALQGLDGTNFSFFIMNDPMGVGIGLAIKLNGANDLKNILSQEEPQLIGQLEPILLPEHSQSKNSFSDYDYNGQAVRYQNLISSQTLALDYAVTNTHLVFATTKLAVENVLNKLLVGSAY